MKKIIALFSTLTWVSALYAQQNFQGEITYKLHASNEEKPDAELKVLFGVNKLKLSFKENESYDRNVVVVRLDSAATYTLNIEEKTYKKKILLVKLPEQKPVNRSIFGYSSTAVIPEVNRLSNFLGGFLSASRTVFYISDSLHYFIPDIYSDNPEFLMIQKNKILLGAEINVKENLNGSSEKDPRNNIITAEAFDIKPMFVNDSAFSIPVDFINAKNREDAFVPAIDSAAAVVDTVVTVPAPRKLTPKKPLKSNNSKTTIKSGAVRRKE